MIKKKVLEAENVNTDFGSILAETRKSKNFTVEQINQQLKISVQTIVAIETSDIAALPEPTFTQGYIRTYAKFLEIPEDKVLALYNLAVPHEQYSELKARVTITDEASSRTPIMVGITLCLILAGLAALIYGVYNYYQEKADDIETQFESKQRNFTGNSPDSLGTQNLNIKQKTYVTTSEEVGFSARPSASQSELSDKESVTGDTVEDVPAYEEKHIAEDLQRTEQIMTENVNQKNLEQIDILKIYAKKGSWMSVRDVTNKRLLYHTVPVRGSMELRGQAPFRVSLGNARSTSLLINDLEIKMSEYIRENNTAKFTVSTKDKNVIFH